MAPSSLLVKPNKKWSVPSPGYKQYTLMNTLQMICTVLGVYRRII